VTERFLYLAAGEAAFPVVLHEPAAPFAQTAVLLVPPFGWEELASYRSRRAWAEDLCAHGHPVLRLDLPGTGDSGGTAADPGTWARWNSAVTAAARWLRSEARAQTVLAVGIGLGGLLAYEAAAGGDIDDLVLWATPARGRSFVRELVAFSAHETARIVEAGAPPPPPLPAGWLAPSGFLLSPETVAHLSALDLAERPLAPSARVLLLDRDGVKPDPRLSAVVAEAGAEVTVRSGAGYSAMLTDPDQARAPREVFERTRAWLLQAEPRSRPAPRDDDTGPTVSEELIAGGVRERPFLVAGTQGRLVGTVAEPLDEAPAPLTAVFLNAGAIRRIGPHRMWADAARRWGLKGVTSLRLDLEGIGDSDGDGELFADVAHFHGEQFFDQARAALDALEDAGLGNRFILVGLCSGAYWAFHTALADDRVAAAVMINPRVLYWDDNLEISRELRRTRLLTKPVIWKRVLRGDVSWARWATFVRWLAGAPLRLVRARRAPERDTPSVDDQIAAAFDRLRDRDLHARFVFCDGEPLFDELTRGDLLDRDDRWPTVSLTRLPGRDHTLRPLWMHEHVVAAMDDALDAELALAGAAVD
jgi:pimeloyl-ACP methyl ester carboxylesterase